MSAGGGFPPGWLAWQSSAGRWWATRTGPDARYGPGDPPMTVDADDEAGLLAELGRYAGAA